MASDEKTLSIAVVAGGRRLRISYEHSTPSTDVTAPVRQVLLDVDLYATDGSWQEWNHRHVGRIVLGALNAYPEHSSAEVPERAQVLLSSLKKLEDEEREGKWDTNSLATRSVLELSAYRRTGNIRHLDNVDSLYRMLSDLGSEEHVEILKTWKTERERLVRGFLDSSNSEDQIGRAHV